MEAETLAAALAAVRAVGLRLTPQRRAILQVLAEERRHLTVQEVQERLREAQPGLSLDTIYRTLRTLAGLGVVCQSHLQTRHPDRFALAVTGHHHHLICLACGASIEFEECELPQALAGVAERHGFQTTGHALEVYGYCAGCREGRARP